MTNQKLIYGLFFSLFIFILGAFFVSGVTLGFNDPTEANLNETFQRGNVTINVSVSEHINITNATVKISNVVGIGTNVSYTFDFTGANTSSFAFTFNSSSGSHPDGRYKVNISVNATNESGGMGGLLNNSILTFFTVDNTIPNATTKFTDEDGTAGTTFDFGEEITVDCQATDHLAGLNETLNAVQIKFPGLTTHQNLTLLSSDLTNTTLKATIDPELTDELGQYNIVCLTYDKVGNLNSTNSTFTIKTKVNMGTSAFAVPDFVAPVGKVKVSSGVTNDGGRLTTEGTSRLMKTTSTIKLDIKGEEHTVTVKTLSESSVVLTIASKPFDVTIEAGETTSVDVNEDGIDDLEITYHKNFPKGGEYADLTFTLTEKPSEVEEEVEEEVKEEVEVPEVGEEYKAPAPGMAVTIAVIAIVLIIGYALIKGKKK